MKAPVAVAMMILSAVCLAAPDKVVYELQERCGKQVSAEFKREFGSVGTPVRQSGDTMFFSYQNHYNSKLNTCIYLLRENGFSTDKSKKAKAHSGVHETQTLIDINENREIGTYSKYYDEVLVQCIVGDKTCLSKEEWETLVKPYLEE